MKDTNIVTKLTKMNVSRIALCKTPADQDGLFVLVKSESGASETDKTEAEDKPADDSVEESVESAADSNSEEVANSAGETDVAVDLGKEFSETIANAIAKAIDEAVKSAIEKSPQMAYLGSDVNVGSNGVGSPNQETDDGGKKAIQNCINVLVKKCNESKTISKDIKMKVADIAKYHGVEGPSTDDDGSASAFAEITAELKTVVDILKAFAVSMPKLTQPPAAPEAPAAKPTPTKKSEDDPRILALEKGFEKVRFLLLQKLGRDPTPPSE